MVCGRGRAQRAFPLFLPCPLLHFSRSYGFFTAVNATVATWTFKTVKADGPGPADYTDSLTLVQAHHGPRRV